MYDKRIEGGSIHGTFARMKESEDAIGRSPSTENELKDGQLILAVNENGSVPDGNNSKYILASENLDTETDRDDVSYNETKSATRKRAADEEGSEEAKQLANSMTFNGRIEDGPIHEPSEDMPIKKTQNDMKSPDDDLDPDGLDPDTVCGIGWFKPKWLKRCATSRVYLVLYSIIGCLSGAYYTYRIGALTTLEKRYAFTSKTSGAIMTIDELSPLFFGPLVGYFGGRAHRPRMFFLGMSIIVICCFVTACPYLIFGTEKRLGLSNSNQKNETGIQMCKKDEENEENCEVDSRPPSVAAVAIIMVAGFMKGAGSLAYNSVGLTYMDDAAEKKNTPLYLATAFTTRLFGPLLGFLMSSVFLKYYENPFDDPGYGPDDPRWIGAWWMGFCLNGVLLFLFSIPILLFPRRLPGHPKIEDEKSSGNSTSWIPSFLGFFAAVKRLLRNPLLAAIMLHDILTIYAFAGYFMMLPKYMENQFRLSASDANLFSGPPGLAAIMLAIVVGSWAVWKYKPKPKTLILGMIAMEVVGIIGYAVMMIPKCETIELSHSGINTDGFILDAACNSNCNCSTKAYTPVCGLDGRTAYFSPCYAGCTGEGNETYTGCSCVPDHNNNEGKNVTSGFCRSDSCWSQALVYLTILSVVHFLGSLLRVPQSMLLLRCTQPEDKSTALGVFEAITCVLGFVTYLVAFGAVVDTTCLVWEESCKVTGNCWFYDVQSLNYLLHGSSVLFSIASAFSLILIYHFSDRLMDFYEEDAISTIVTEHGAEASVNEKKTSQL